MFIIYARCTAAVPEDADVSEWGGGEGGGRKRERRTERGRGSERARERERERERERVEYMSVSSFANIRAMT